MDEGTFEKSPEEVAFRAARKANFASGNTILGITEQDGAVNKSETRIRFQQLDLGLECTWQAKVIIVKEDQKFARTDLNSSVARASLLHVWVKPDVAYAAYRATDLRRLIRRAVIDDNHFRISTGVFRAFNRLRQQSCAVIGGNDNANFCHDSYLLQQSLGPKLIAIIFAKPLDGPLESFFETYSRLPLQNLPRPGAVSVHAPDFRRAVRQGADLNLGAGSR